MKLIIESGRELSSDSLSFKIAGFSIELLDFSHSGKLVINEDSGKVSIELISIDEDPLIPEKTADSEEVMEEYQKEAPISEAIPEEQFISHDLLFQSLVALRRDIAKESKLPPYIIFHDKTLKEMVSKLPVNLEEMKGVSGVGNTRLEKYGDLFISVIKDYLEISS